MRSVFIRQAKTVVSRSTEAAAVMNLSTLDQALLLATYFRGNLPNQNGWTSSSDQVLVLSLFYLGEITAAECQSRFSCHRYLRGLYAANGSLNPRIMSQYMALIQLLRRLPELIEGGGDFESPADPTYTACRLTATGIGLIPEIIDMFPRKPDFPNWPDSRTYSISDSES
jgi:hypothetical protein